MAQQISNSSSSSSVVPATHTFINAAKAGFEPLLDDEQASGLLGGIHIKTLQSMARNGRLPAFRIGRYWRYRASELNEWLKTQSTIKSSLPITRVNQRGE